MTDKLVRETDSSAEFNQLEGFWNNSCRKVLLELITISLDLERNPYVRLGLHLLWKPILPSNDRNL